MNPSSNGTAGSSNENGVFLDRLAQLRVRFVERMRQDVIVMRALRDRWQDGEPLAGELLRDIKHMAHGLSGAAGVFGFHAISEAAHRLERAARAEDGKPFDPAPLFEVLETEMSAVDQSIGTEPATPR